MAVHQRLNKKDLPDLAHLDTGGQGSVYSTTLQLKNPPCELVYKEYRQDIASGLDESILLSMIDYIKTIPQRDALRIISICSWPLFLVEDGSPGRTAGFLMPRVPSKFDGLQIRTVKGPTSTIGEIQHLLNSEDQLRKRYSLSLTEGLRYNLLSKVASALSTLHQRQIVVGDLSPKNLLFSLNPSCEVYFLDADAMRFQGRSALPQVETPGWSIAEAYPSETLATTSSDIYKLGLLALRLLLGSQNASQNQSLPTSIPRPVRSLIQESLSRMSHNRPSLKEWMDVLQPLSTDVAAQPQTPNHAQISRSIPVAPVPLSQPPNANTSSAAPPYSRLGLIPTRLIAFVASKKADQGLGPAIALGLSAIALALGWGLNGWFLLLGGIPGFWSKNKALAWVATLLGLVLLAAGTYAPKPGGQEKAGEAQRPPSNLELVARDSRRFVGDPENCAGGWVRSAGPISGCFDIWVAYPDGSRAFMGFYGRRWYGSSVILIIEPIGGRARYIGRSPKQDPLSDPPLPLLSSRGRYGAVGMRGDTPILNLPHGVRAYGKIYTGEQGWKTIQVFPTSYQR